MENASFEGLITRKGAREQAGSQLAGFLEQQSKSIRRFHRWMKVLEFASLGLVAAVFGLAMYLSINWTTVPRKAIPTAWLAFPVSVSLTLLLLGLHTVVLRAYPTALSGKNRPAVIGREALGRGWALVLGGLIAGAFWGLIAYSAWTVNWAILTPLIGLLGGAVGVVIVISVFAAMVRQFVSR